MKINVNQIPAEGLTLDESLPAKSLDLETDFIKFDSPLTIHASLSKITTAVTAEITLKGVMRLVCSRCLGEFRINLDKGLQLSYMISRPGETIDLNPDIREEIILDYPIRALCKEDCKGICPVCGTNLNEKKCDCSLK